VIQFVNVDGKPPKKDPDSKRRFSESQQRNNGSMVIKLKYKNVSFLLTSDINGRHKDHIGVASDEECDSVEKFLVNLDANATTTGIFEIRGIEGATSRRQRVEQLTVPAESNAQMGRLLYWTRV
jgi:hypothetical protein